MRADTYPRRRWSPPLGETTDPEDMYPPVVTGPPPPELSREPGAPLEINGAEYNFETGMYLFVYECDEGNEFYATHTSARHAHRVFCRGCHQHHDLAPIRGA